VTSFAPAIANANIDGTFRIGVLLPTSGTARSLAEPMLLAIDMAAADINNNGGLFGKPVVVVRRDEGADAASASTAFAELVDTDRADVIVGPASSRVALGLIDRIAARTVPTCSPAATAIALETQADNSYFFRTVPSDSLEASAMARLIASTGQRSTTIVYPDDDFGRSMNALVRAGLERFGNTVLPAVPYDTNTSQFSAITARVLNEPTPDTVAVIGLPDPGARLLAALRSAGGTRLQAVVNAGLRRNDLFASIPGGKPDILDNVRGVSPSAEPLRQVWATRYAAFSRGASDAYAAYAYDCTLLLALAALTAGSDDGPSIMANVGPTSLGGTPCFEFKECADLIVAGRNIDFYGNSGKLDLLANGDPDSGRYDVFTFDKAGRDQSSDTPLEVTAST
jgi:branched-chain amino acid transport system substrate-binding protein